MRGVSMLHRVKDKTVRARHSAWLLQALKSIRSYNYVLHHCLSKQTQKTKNKYNPNVTKFKKLKSCCKLLFLSH